MDLLLCAVGQFLIFFLNYVTTRAVRAMYERTKSSSVRTYTFRTMAIKCIFTSCLCELPGSKLQRACARSPNTYNSMAQSLCTGFLIVFFCSFFGVEVKVFTYSFIFLNYVFVGVLTVAVPRNLKIENKRAVRKRETC